MGKSIKNFSSVTTIGLDIAKNVVAQCPFSDVRM
jgi:hypothetical protein